MQGERSRVRDLDEPARSEAIARAADVLRAGGIAVFPTETVYGVGVRADDQAAVDRLRSLLRDGPDQPLALHAPTVDAALEGLDLQTPVARRLARTLIPGPATLILGQPPEALAARRKALGTGAGVIDDGAIAAVRVPDHDIAAEFLDAAGGPVVATSLRAVTLGVGTGEAPSVDDTWPDAAGDAGAALLDDGPARLGTPSTRVRIGTDGKLEVSEGGPLSEADVLSRLEIRVLFVCTGNTCRSPMAEAMARHIASERTPNGVTFRFESAGVAAGDGMDASGGAAEAGRRRGVDLSAHRSRQVTPRMIEMADAIFTMTPSHAEAVMTLVPSAAHKVEPLNPRGLIADPIGQPVDVYEQTLAEMEPLIRSRLEGLEP